MDTNNTNSEWSFQILINEFEDDNYWDMSLQEDMPEVFDAITSIGKKYSDINDYEQALELYEKYEPQVIEYYGGSKAVEFIIDEFDTIPVGIIKPPKLRGKLREKYVEGVSGGIGRYYEPVTPEEQMEWDKGRFGDEGNPEGTEIPDITRSLKRALRATVIKKNMAASVTSFNTDIISQIRNGDYSSHDKSSKDSMRNMGLDEHEKLYDKRHEQKYETPSFEDLKAAVGDKAPVYRYSLDGTNELPIDILVKKAMINSGLKPMTDKKRENLTDRERSRLLSYIDAAYVYDDKAMRKLIKKTNKENRAREKERARYDRAYDRHMEKSSRAMQELLTAKTRISRMFSSMEDDD